METNVVYPPSIRLFRSRSRFSFRNCREFPPSHPVYVDETTGLNRDGKGQRGKKKVKEEKGKEREKEREGGGREGEGEG